MDKDNKTKQQSGNNNGFPPSYLNAVGKSSSNKSSEQEEKNKKFAQLVKSMEKPKPSGSN